MKTANTLKAIIAVAIVGIAALCSSIKADAQEFHIKKMVCVETEGLLTADAIYIKYRINGGTSIRFPASSDLSFTEGTERSNLCYINANSDDTIHVEVWDHDTFDPDDYIGSFDVRVDRPKEQTVTLRQTDGIAVYRITYVLE